MAYFHCLIGGGSSGGGYTLTVTCDSQFAGTTITCTDGVTTLTQTCPSASPYEVEFEIPNGGDWTISGVVSGQTVTTGVNIPTTAELIAFVHKTITIYSAKEDTVTYTDIYGDTQTEVFAIGQTSKSITVDIMPSGSSITFTSGVAKDPSDLTTYYSKTVTIDSNTTDVYLMPDRAIYWWGYEENAFSGSFTKQTNYLYCGSSNNYFYETIQSINYDGVTSAYTIANYDNDATLYKDDANILAELPTSGTYPLSLFWYDGNSHSYNQYGLSASSNNTKIFLLARRDRKYSLKVYAVVFT